MIVSPEAILKEGPFWRKTKISEPKHDVNVNTIEGLAGKLGYDIISTEKKECPSETDLNPGACEKIAKDLNLYFGTTTAKNEPKNCIFTPMEVVGGIVQYNAYPNDIRGGSVSRPICRIVGEEGKKQQLPCGKAVGPHLDLCGTDKLFLHCEPLGKQCIRKEDIIACVDDIYASVPEGTEWFSGMDKRFFDESTFKDWCKTKVAINDDDTTKLQNYIKDDFMTNIPAGYFYYREEFNNMTENLVQELKKKLEPTNSSV